MAPGWRTACARIGTSTNGLTPRRLRRRQPGTLNTLASMFNGDWHLALASYNGGPGRLQKALKRGQAEDFWTLARNPRLLPRETRDYVPMILAAIVIAKNPSQYGFEFETDTPHDYETVTLEKPVDLRRIAEWTDTTIGTIQTLNPELRRWTTPIRDDAYALKVPTGTADIVPNPPR
ncbi:MAG: transglycosylase SLT domain-containing protein [Vicinamibacterales bacterium]